MKERKKSHLNQLIVSAITFTFTLIAFIHVSFAWFVQNHNASAKSIDLSVDTPEEMKVRITIHDCIGTDIDGVYYFNKEESASNDLKTYSLLTENNRQLLVHVHFEDPEIVHNVSLLAKTQTNYFLGDGNHPLLGTIDGKGDTYDNVLSSIVAFYIVNAEDTTYESYEAYQISSLGNQFSFINKNNYTLNRSLILVNKQSVSDIYLVIDYHPDLVYKVFSENLTNPAFQELGGVMDAKVSYIWDITLELKQVI